MTEENAGAKTESQEVKDTYVGDTVRASWPFSLHTIRANLAHCRPEGREALVSAFLWCIDSKHPVAKPDFAKRVGYSENAIYRMLSGKYIAADDKRQLDVPDELIKAIRNFLALERERFVGGKTTFVMTPTAARIWKACDLARESKSPVFVWGRSHVGKTWALEAYTADNNHGRTVYCRMKAASGLGGMVRRLCEKIGVSPNSNTADLVDRIKEALTPDMLVVLDELHLLMYTYRKQSFFGCLEVLREIYDESQCGLVLCGTRLLQERVNEKELEQLLRRGVHRIVLPEYPTSADVSAILKSSGLEMPKRGMEVTVQAITENPYEVLRQLAIGSGLKAITERLRYARKLASRKQCKVSWQDFIEAHLSIANEMTSKNKWD